MRFRGNVGNGAEKHTPIRELGAPPWNGPLGALVIVRNHLALAPCAYERETHSTCRAPRFGRGGWSRRRHRLYAWVCCWP